MKQLAMILSLVMFLFIMVIPMLEFTHHHHDEEAEAHLLSDCDCGCPLHFSLQAVVAQGEITDCTPMISFLDNETLIPPDPPVFSLYRPPRLFS